MSSASKTYEYHLRLPAFIHRHQRIPLQENWRIRKIKFSKLPQREGGWNINFKGVLGWGGEKAGRCGGEGGVGEVGGGESEGE